MSRLFFDHGSIQKNMRLLAALFITLWIMPHARASATDNSPEAHWTTPIAPQQGEIPTPQQCGICHEDKLAQWSGSRHAAAFSPGLVGQLLTYTTDEAQQCLACHTPLAEQHQAALSKQTLREWAAGKETSPAQHGVFCAACHLRQGHVVAAPSPTKREVHTEGPRPEWFRESRFCARCHQFPQEYAINGKPLENTYQEWLQSDFAKQGITCQNCHMPDRRHLFRGIHDPETVRKGVTITTQSTAREAVLTLRSTGIGHAFPTYVVPKVRLTGILLDKKGQKIPAGLRNRTLQRVVTYGSTGWQEISDSRLLPGETVSIAVPWQFGKYRGNQVYFQIIVEPDHYYIHDTFKSLLAQLPRGLPQTLIQKADREARSNTYTLFETTLRKKPARRSNP